MKRWPLPTSVKALRGFLGLTVYYHKFVKDYGVIAAPITSMSKKHASFWSDESWLAFETLKNLMMTTPVLTSRFYQVFVVKCDASDLGVGNITTVGLPYNVFPRFFGSMSPRPSCL